MDTNTLDTQLYLTRDEHATLLKHVDGTARHIDGTYPQLTPASMTTILNTIEAAGGHIPEGLEVVHSAVEAAWLELHGPGAGSRLNGALAGPERVRVRLPRLSGGAALQSRLLSSAVWTH